MGRADKPDEYFLHGPSGLLRTTSVRKPAARVAAAYAFRGKGTTIDRALKIEALYERCVQSRPTKSTTCYVQKFIDAVKELVKGAIEGTSGALAGEAETAAGEAA
jgi:hypothetical protein